MKIEVIEIYLSESTGKHLARGSVHIFIKDWDMDIKNIPYNINEEKILKNHVYHVYVTHPCYYYKHIQDDGSVKTTRVPTISFRDEQIWKEIKKVIREAILSKFEKELPLSCNSS